MKKIKAIVLTIIVLILGLIINFLFEIMPDDFKNSVTDFAGNIGLSYPMFWFICTLLIVVVMLFFVWKQALNNQKEKTKILNETDTIKTTGNKNKRYKNINNSTITDNSINQTHSGTGDNVGRDKITGK